MNINVQTINFESNTEGLNEYIEAKFGKLEQFYDKIVGAQVNFRIEKTSDKKDKFVDVILEIPGDDLIVKKNGQSFEECIDLAVDALKKMIIKRKQKTTSR